MHTLHRFFIVLASALLLSVCGSAQAGIFRAYLSTNGSDTYPCTLAQPCRLLPAALAAVNDDGEIWMLDSANYNTGPVNITKPVTILAVPGALGSVIGTGGDAITISVGVDVTLRNLNVIYMNGGERGVSVTADGARVIVEKCEIYGFEEGIGVPAAATLTIIDSTIRNNTNGVRLDGGAVATISRSNFVDNAWVGVWANPTTDSIVTAFVVDSVSSGNAFGVAASGESESRRSNVYAVRSSVMDNENMGYAADPTHGSLTVGDGMSVGNGWGIYSGGVVNTASNNFVAGNELDIALPPTPLTLK